MSIPTAGTNLQARGNCCAGSPATVRAFVEQELARGVTYMVGWFAFGGMQGAGGDAFGGTVRRRSDAGFRMREG